MTYFQEPESNTIHTPLTDTNLIFLEGSKCGALVRSLDWSQTPMGPLNDWPQNLRAVVGICLASRFPMIVLWGQALIQIYNDDYGLLMGDKHPQGMGQPTHECWPEIWHINQPIYEAVLARGETVYLENQLFPIERKGYLEEAYFTLCYSPIWAVTGGVEGVFITLLETTNQVLIAQYEEERRHAEQALAESAARLHFAQLAAEAGSWEWDIKISETRWSPEYYILYGLETPIPPSFENWIALIYPEDQERVQREFETQIRSRQNHNIEFRILHPQKGLRWLSSRGQTLYDEAGQPARVIGITIDITERKQAEIELKTLNETLEERVEERTRQVRNLTSALTLAEQHERRRIAQILHDDLQQLLYSLQLRIEILGADAASGQIDRLSDNFESIRNLLNRTIQTTRTLTIDLSPPVLQEEGLDAAIAWLASQMKELHDLEVSIELVDPCLIHEKDMRVLLYQLVRELLFNAVKHADTRRAHIICGSRNDQIIITVQDWGKGFDLAAATQRHHQEGHFGLFSIRERLMLVGGDLKIETASGQGTRVTISAPCNSTLAARTPLKAGKSPEPAGG